MLNDEEFAELVRFTGTLRQRCDGHNNEGEGTVADGRRLEFGATPFGAEYRVDGVITENPVEVEYLDAYVSDLWPDRDGDWNARVEAGRVVEVKAVDLP